MGFEPTGATRWPIVSVFRNIAIVAAYFPLSVRAGVGRARHLAKYVPNAGWTSIVLCVDPSYNEKFLDPAIAALVPEETLGGSWRLARWFAEVCATSRERTLGEG